MSKYLVSVEKQERKSCEGAVTSKTISYVRSSERSAQFFISTYIRRLRKIYTGVIVTHSSSDCMTVERRPLNRPWIMRWHIRISRTVLEDHNKEVFSTVKAKAAENIPDYSCVVSIDGKIYKASFDNYDVIGIVIDGVNKHETATVIVSGVIRNKGWDWTEGSNIVMTQDGGLTQEIGSNDPLVIIGNAVDKDSININLLIVRN